MEAEMEEGGERGGGREGGRWGRVVVGQVKVEPIHVASYLKGNGGVQDARFGNV